MRICQLSPEEALRFERDGIIPNCAHHHHTSTDDAAEGVSRTALRWVGGGERRVVDTPKYVWVASGETWQMRNCYGNAAKHFRRTRCGMNYAPNKSSHVSDHIDRAAFAR